MEKYGKRLHTGTATYAAINLIKRNLCRRHKLKDSIRVLSYNSLLNNYGFISATRLTHVSSTCFGHTFLKYKHVNGVKRAIFYIGITDHCVLGLKIELQENYNKNMDRNVVKYDYVAIKNDLALVDWNFIYSMKDINRCFDCLIETLNKSVAKNKNISI